MLLCLTFHNVYDIPDITGAKWLSKYAFTRFLELSACSSRKPHDFLVWYQADPDAKKSEAYQKPPTIGPGADAAPILPVQNFLNVCKCKGK